VAAVAEPTVTHHQQSVVQRVGSQRHNPWLLNLTPGPPWHTQLPQHTLRGRQYQDVTLCDVRYVMCDVLQQ